MRFTPRCSAVCFGVFVVLVSPSVAQEPPNYDSPLLPVVMIDVGGREVTRAGKAPGTMKLVERHDGTLRDLAASPVAVRSNISLQLRGSTSAAFEKRSYDVELHDERGRDRDLPLLGLPADSDWALHGCGRGKTCLRNVLAYSLARDFGHYAPRTRFVELFVDGRYDGVYVLVERVRRSPDRVALPKPAADAASGDLTGGYIFKMDLAQGTPDDPVPRDWVSKVSPMVYSYQYPRFDNITPAQKAYLQDYVARFETMMKEPGWNNPQTGYRAWIDVPSWVDFALLQEVSNNVDAYFKSVYLQKWPASRGNRLALGPVWDFDAAFGLVDFRNGRRTDAWAHDMNEFGALAVPYNPPERVPLVPAYWERLWSDPAFQNDVRCRWQQLRQGPLSMATVNAKVDGWTKQLALAQPRDGVRWNNGERFAERVRSMREWLAARVSWMDGNLPGQCPPGARAG